MKTVPTVEELRKQGYKVTVKHRRLFFKYDSFTGKRQEKMLSMRDANTAKNRDYYLSATGGDTFVKIESEKYLDGLVGVADCASQDKFCKAKGRKKAIAKAFAPVMKELRNSGN